MYPTFLQLCVSPTRVGVRYAFGGRTFTDSVEGTMYDGHYDGDRSPILAVVARGTPMLGGLFEWVSYEVLRGGGARGVIESYFWRCMEHIVKQILPWHG